MYILNGNSNILNPACEVFFFNNISCRLTACVDGRWSIWILGIQGFGGWVRAIGIFWLPSRRLIPQILWNGLQILIAFCLTNGLQIQKDIGWISQLHIFSLTRSLIRHLRKQQGYLIFLGMEVTWGNFLKKFIGCSAPKARGIHDGTVRKFGMYPIRCLIVCV